MKTRSKRFLKLATLCLALLSTTLLMAQPVKARDNQSQQQEHVSNNIVEDSQKNDSDYDQGYKEGYKDGQKEGAPADPDKKEDEFKNKSLRYGDGYYLGYYRGWDETNRPFQTLLKDIYLWLWETFFK
ncbi:TPA: hypothetical protein VH789_000461 [Streptococcus pyogenes]|nr:hypothetical protein [Streptococcus pyogenes]HEQ8331097.1 hypothetical protein [Streptococcus pyogenes]HEQ9248184.1 hypothetical protein [Streptococcus pyogenes]HEQ9258874.1 hypothetical protein [Streptococcus pyogenes]HEQ9537227.1 hypothetical protein [Streptococcus pyogenes]